MRTKHPSDAAFETWVTAGEGEEKLRTHVVQAGFREGWNAARTEYEKVLSALVELLASVNVATLEDPSHYRVANTCALAALVARDVVDRHGLEQDLAASVQARMGNGDAGG